MIFKRNNINSVLFRAILTVIVVALALSGCPAPDDPMNPMNPMDMDPMDMDPMDDNDATEPGTMTAPTLYAGTERLIARWSAPEDDGGSPITAYELRYNTGGGTWTEMSSDITDTNHTITDLTNGESYTVQLRAVNALGSGDWSMPAMKMPQFSATYTPRPVAGAADETVNPSAALADIITNENLSVSVTTGTHAVDGSGDIMVTQKNPSGATIIWPTVDAGTGIVTVTETTTAGTYLVSGTETGTDNTLFAEYFTITVSPQTNAALKTAVNTGITAWGSTADLNYILTEAVTNMTHAFNGWQLFNGDISDWDVSKVTNMNGMFSSARAFNGDISSWETSKVMNMKDMFRSAYAFNRDISSWETGAVTTMENMFRSAYAFNGDISGWDTTAVTTMAYMFNDADAFNGDISGWKTGAVTNMKDMFWRADAFNGDISGWDVSKVTNMEKMFWDAPAFNQDLAAWGMNPGRLMLNASGKYTGTDSLMFSGSRVGGSQTGDVAFPSWYNE
ncbi:MAG: BspA family leucine-rich repeat surface protein [Salinispira sp.]